MAASGKKGGGAMVLIIVVFLLSIAGAGAGFTVGTLISGEPAPAAKEAETKPEEPAKDEKAQVANAAADDRAAKAEAEEATEEAAADEEPQEEPVDLRALKVTRFPPVLTTLAEPKGKWIRLEGAILTGSDGETPPELLAERSGEQILAFLRTLRLSQIEGPSGYLGLKSDLDETVKVLSGGEVQGVLIHGLVVE